MKSVLSLLILLSFCNSILSQGRRDSFVVYKDSITQPLGKKYKMGITFGFFSKSTSIQMFNNKTLIFSNSPIDSNTNLDSPTDFHFLMNVSKKKRNDLSIKINDREYKIPFYYNYFLLNISSWSQVIKPDMVSILQIEYTNMPKPDL